MPNAESKTLPAAGGIQHSFSIRRSALAFSIQHSAFSIQHFSIRHSPLAIQHSIWPHLRPTYNGAVSLLRQLRRELTSSWLNVLLVAAPVSWVLDRRGPSFSVFVTSAIALIPAAGLIGAGTEALAR